MGRCIEAKSLYIVTLRAIKYTDEGLLFISPLGLFGHRPQIWLVTKKEQRREIDEKKPSSRVF